MSWRVRAAGAADAPALERIWVDAGRAAWAHILRPETVEGLAAPDAVRRSVEEPSWLVLVVERGDEVVGFADAVPDGTDGAAVRAFFTAPAVWGLGAGRALMDALLARLAASGVRSARLWTAAANARPRRFYERAGWKLDGTERAVSWQGSDFVEVGYRIEVTTRGRA